MAKISINLLPVEFKIEQLKKAKFYKIQTFGVITFMFVVFLSSLTIALRILQSSKISQIRTKVSASEQKITDLKNVQAALLLLKNRITVIDQYLGNPSKQVQMYKYMVDSLPSFIVLNSITVDKEGSVTLVAVSSDISSVDSWISSLTTKEKNQGQISKVSLESLNKGRDGVYRMNIKIQSN